MEEISTKNPDAFMLIAAIAVSELRLSNCLEANLEVDEEIKPESSYSENVATLVGIVSLINQNDTNVPQGSFPRLSSCEVDNLLCGIRISNCFKIVENILDFVHNQICLLADCPPDYDGLTITENFQYTLATISTLAQSREIVLRENPDECLDNHVKSFFHRLLDSAVFYSDLDRRERVMQIVETVAINQHLRIQLLEALVFFVLESKTDNDISPETENQKLFDSLELVLQVGYRLAENLQEQISNPVSIKRFNVMVREVKRKRRENVPDFSATNFGPMNRAQKSELATQLEVWIDILSKASTGLHHFQFEFCSRLYILQGALQAIIKLIT